MKNILIELLGERFYLMEQKMFNGISRQVRANIELHRAHGMIEEENLQSLIRFTNGAPTTTEFNTKMFVGNADNIADRYHLDKDDKIINVIRLTGPMTRGGGACSYGSIDLRDMLMSAANIPQTAGHIIYTRTPGGAASSLQDFKHAIDYAHEQGQKVYMYCDGDVASGGAFLSALCDGVYYMNDEDRIGSLGLYIAGYFLKPGTEDKTTGEVYQEYYAEKSTDKNKAYRDAANGDMKALAAEANEYLDRLLTETKANNPRITDEQLTGKMYRMVDVVGSLVDGRMTMMELAQMIHDDHIKKATNPKETSSVSLSTSDGGAQANDNEGSPLVNNNSVTTNNEMIMKNYKSVAEFLGVESFETAQDGTLTLQSHEAEALEQKIEEHNSLVTTLTDENTQLKQEIDDEKVKHQSAIGDTEDLKAEVEEKQNTIDGQGAELEDLRKQLADRDTQISVLSQTEKDLNTRVAELENSAAAVNAGAAPSTNGDNGETTMVLVTAPAYDPNLSAVENTKRQQDYYNGQ